MSFCLFFSQSVFEIACLLVVLCSCFFDIFIVMVLRLPAYTDKPRCILCGPTHTTESLMGINADRRLQLLTKHNLSVIGGLKLCTSHLRRNGTANLQAANRGPSALGKKQRPQNLTLSNWLQKLKQLKSQQAYPLPLPLIVVQQHRQLSLPCLLLLLPLPLPVLLLHLLLHLLQRLLLPRFSPRKRGRPAGSLGVKTTYVDLMILFLLHVSLGIRSVALSALQKDFPPSTVRYNLKKVREALSTSNCKERVGCGFSEIARS